MLIRIKDDKLTCFNRKKFIPLHKMKEIFYNYAVTRNI